MDPLAKWNSAPHTAKISSGRLSSSVAQGEGRCPPPAASGTSPRASSWSIAAAGSAATASTLATAVSAIIANTTDVPRKGAVARITRLIAPFPRWNRASLRPARRAKRHGPTTPSDMAARVGPMVVPARAPTTPAAATDQKCGDSGITRQVAVTTSTAPARSARLLCTASTMAPSGVCDTSPTRPPQESARPMLASSQACSVNRITARYAPSP